MVVITLSDLSAVWQTASANAFAGGKRVSQNAIVFTIQKDVRGRYYVCLTDKNANLVHFQDVLWDDTPLGNAMSLFCQNVNARFSWSQESNVLYFDENPELTQTLFLHESFFAYNEKMISVSKVSKKDAAAFTERKIILFLEKAQGSTGALSYNAHPAFLDAQTDERDVCALSPFFVLSNDTIFRVHSLGPQYTSLAYFYGTISADEIETFLSFFASLFPHVPIFLEGYTTVKKPLCTAEPSLQFRGLDQAGNLSLSFLWTREPFANEFISKQMPSVAVKINDEDNTIERYPIFYDDAAGYIKKLEALLRLCKKNHPEISEEGQGYVTSDNTILISASLALPFLTENVGELSKKYRLFGTDALKAYKMRAVSPKTKLRIGSGIDFFDTTCEIHIDDEIFSPKQFVTLYEEHNFIPLTDGTRAIIDRSFFLRLKRILGKEQKGGVYKISLFDLPIVDNLIDAKIETAPSCHWRDFYDGFNDIGNRELPAVPVAQKLRDYQSFGVKWLSYLAEHNMGGCLADDMGLGKTIQTITLLSGVYAQKKDAPPSLVVVPKSLIENWQNEIKTFSPELDVYTYYGTERSLPEAVTHQIVLTTYALVRNDSELLQKEHFLYIILDEVQAIKNAQSHASKAVMLLNGQHRFALSGTPMENNVGELYALFRFLNPSMFGTEGDFNSRYATPIQKEGDENASRELSAKIRPFILRRLKQDVAKELPARTEQMLYVDMTPEQASLYETQRRFYKELINGEIAKNGFEKSQFCILQALSELRQIATVPESKTSGEVVGAKWDTLIETITELAESGHRSLVFSNFLSSLDAVGERLSLSKIDYLLMTGATANRAELVQRFQKDDSYKVFLMTLKTGGVGLNLTAADYVFILDPWWNRSAEQQAIDRTHRIGQTKSVFCYRLIARGTIEEKILELQKKKTDLFSAVISTDGQLFKKLVPEDIEYLLRG